jgi:hypothetical protein
MSNNSTEFRDRTVRTVAQERAGKVLLVVRALRHVTSIRPMPRARRADRS